MLEDSGQVHHWPRLSPSATERTSGTTERGKKPKEQHSIYNQREKRELCKRNSPEDPGQCRRRVRRCYRKQSRDFPAGGEGLRAVIHSTWENEWATRVRESWWEMYLFGSRNVKSPVGFSQQKVICARENLNSAGWGWESPDPIGMLTLFCWTGVDDFQSFLKPSSCWGSRALWNIPMQNFYHSNFSPIVSESMWLETQIDWYNLIDSCEYSVHTGWNFL